MGHQRRKSFRSKCADAHQEKTVGSLRWRAAFRTSSSPQSVCPWWPFLPASEGYFSQRSCRCSGIAWSTLLCFCRLQRCFAEYRGNCLYFGATEQRRTISLLINASNEKSRNRQAPETFLKILSAG